MTDLPCTEIVIPAIRKVLSRARQKNLPPPELLGDRIGRATRNVFVNTAKKRQLLTVHPQRSGKVSIFGNGKSWKPKHVPKDGAIWAAGKAAGKRLNEAGVTPDVLVITNPDTKGNLPLAKEYIFAAMVDPSLWDRYPHAKLFHAKIEGNPAYPKMEESVGVHVTTGLTTGANAMTLASCLGYREVHIYGYDSSGTKTGYGGEVTVQCEGKTYQTTIWHFKQANNFGFICQEAIERGVRIFAHGEGFLYSIVKWTYMEEYTTPANHFVYDCGRNSPSFDFCTAFIEAEQYRRMKGCTEPLRVKLANMADKHDYDGKAAHLRWQMYHNVMRPCLKWFGAIEDDTIESDRLASPAYNVLVRRYRRGIEIPKIRSGEMRIRDPHLLTVTLREAEYMPERNTNLENWMAFARKRQEEGYRVVFIRDTAKACETIPGFDMDAEAAVDIDPRLRLYESAFCNLTLGTGPATMLLFSDSPFVFILTLGLNMNYSPQYPEWWTATADTPPGSKFPWLNDDQIMHWLPYQEKDTVEHIEAAWNKWLEATEGRMAA